MKIFSGSASICLSQKVCNLLGVQLGACDTLNYSDGNIGVRFNESVQNEEVFIIQSIDFQANNQLIELVFWIDAAKRNGAKMVTAIIPFFSYTKSDKIDEPGTTIRGRVCVSILESVGLDRVVLTDLHSPQFAGFFKIPVINLSSIPLLAENLKEHTFDNFSVVSPDLGFLKSARIFSQILNVPLVVCEKKRNDNCEPFINEVYGDVNGKNLIVVDDFSSSFKTMHEVADALVQRGANRLIGCLVHPFLTNNGFLEFTSSPYEELIVTDSIFFEKNYKEKKITVFSIASLISNSIKELCSPKN